MIAYCTHCCDINSEKDGHCLQCGKPIQLVGTPHEEVRVPFAHLTREDRIAELAARASAGTQRQHDLIQVHMHEYFQRWPTFRDRLTPLEWYHLFLDFLEFIEDQNKVI